MYSISINFPCWRISGGLRSGEARHCVFGIGARRISGLRRAKSRGTRTSSPAPYRGTSWHIVAHRGTCARRRSEQTTAMYPLWSFVQVSRLLRSDEKAFQKVRESTKYTRKFLKCALFALHQPSCPIMPVQWANGKHFCQERSIQNDLGTSRTLSDSTPHPWIDINSIQTRKLQNCQTPINTQGIFTFIPTLRAFKSSSFFCTSLPAQSKTQSGQQQSLDATQKMIMMTHKSWQSGAIFNTLQMPKVLTS